jgi:hypothetical protein
VATRGSRRLWCPERAFNAAADKDSCAETGGIRAHEQAGVGRDRLNDGAIRPSRRSENLYEAECLRAVSRSRPSPSGRADCSH